MPEKIMKDDYGNRYIPSVKAYLGKIRYSQTFLLPSDKTTLKGEYPKFKKDDECAFPTRQCCNYGIGFKRCEYMKCKRMGEWYCSYHKTPTENSNEKVPEKGI